MSYQISVRPAQDGWTLKGDTFDNGLMFLSGAEAEIAARALADRYARVGEQTEIRIYLRDGALAGRFVCEPYAPEGAGDAGDG